jgi:hypothetical protein
VIVLSVLNRFNNFEKLLRKNHFLTVKRCQGRHAIQITARNESPTGLLTLVYLESDFHDGLYPGFTFKTLTGRSGLEIGIQVKV